MNYKEEISISEKALKRNTIISFTIFIALIIGTIFLWKKLHQEAQIAQAPKTLRKVLDANGKISSGFLSDNHLAKTYPASAAVKSVRVNGNVGMGNNFDPSSWMLQVVRNAGDTLLLTLDDIKALPKTEIIFDFKCIEGWSQVTHWGGVKFSDFVQHYGLQKEAALGYVGLSTPDDEYYVGIDTPSAMHPQTLLCYQMNGKPLEARHGAPLRLIIPIKYGVKNLKRIGKLYFSNDRPRDYWFERGYDYYCGL